jgi:hypothetical protein
MSTRATAAAAAQAGRSSSAAALDLLRLVAGDTLAGTWILGCDEVIFLRIVKEAAPPVSISSKHARL